MAVSYDSKLNSTPVSLRTQTESTNEYRVVVFGSAGVGKSSLVLRFVKGTFKETYVPTIEDTYRQIINCNKQVCTLQITDTTGSHQFPAMQRLNIQKGHAFVLVYSITNKQSIEELKPIYKDILEIKGSDEIKNTPIILIGSKSDEISNRDVPTSIGAKLAQDWQCLFMETSSKNNHNVKEAFQDLLKFDARNTLTLNGTDSNTTSNITNKSTKSISSHNDKDKAKKTSSDKNNKPKTSKNKKRETKNCTIT
jgi:DIRAS family GTP-binding Ras-like protein 2